MVFFPNTKTLKIFSVLFIDLYPHFAGFRCPVASWGLGVDASKKSGFVDANTYAKKEVVAVEF